MSSASPAPGAVSPGWIVLKFGGTSVSRRARWDTIGRLMRKRLEEEGTGVLVVVSALSGITNALQAIIDGHADVSAVRDAVASIIERHRAFCGELEVDADAVLGDRFQALEALADDARRATAELDWQAELLAQGELMSSMLGVAYLRSGGLDLAWTDARDWLQARALPNQSAWGRRLSATCDLEGATGVRQRFAANGRLQLSQGFIVRGDDGGTAVLGRGGSDTSAACFGALLGASRVEIWTDVPGMFSANPRQVPDARLLQRLDYEEAQEIATTGAKVLHPRCIHPCREAGVPLWIRDTERPDFPGTVIDARAASVPGVKAISSRGGIVLVSMETIGMWQQVGFLAEVFDRFRRHGLSVDMIGSSETNVTVSLDPSENLVNTNVLEALSADLATICRVKVIAPCAAVTLVGRGMRSLLHRLSDVLAEFGRERVHLISQSSNDLNLTFVIDEGLADGLLPRLHELLIGSGAMPAAESAVFGVAWNRLDAPDAVRTPPWWMRERERLQATAQAGTPCYVYHLPTVRERARELMGVDAVDQRFFALKANPHPKVLQALEVEGFGFECVSAGELAHLFEVLPELSPQRVLFTPSFAPRSDYADALRRGVHVTIDNAFVLRQWPELFQGRSLMLRLDPGFGSGHHEKVRTGGKEAKFGLALDALPDLLDAVRAVEARIVGLHAHIGSGIHDAGHWREVYGRLAAVAEGIGTVSVIDVGGGLGVAYDPDASPFDIAAYAAALSEVKQAYPRYRLWIEPGRYLVAEAGALLLGVTQVVEKSGVRRIGADAGMNVLLRPALYNAWHEIVNLDRLDEPPGRRRSGGADLRDGRCARPSPCAARGQTSGDVLLVGHAGAYGAVMANTYNLRALPREEVIDV